MLKTLKSVVNKLVSIELWAVAGFTAISALFERFLLPAVILIVVFFALRLISGNRFFRTPSDWGIIGLVLMLPVTLWASAIPEKTIPQVLRLVVGIGLYYSIVNSTTSDSKLVRIFSLAPALGMFLAIFGLVNTIWILGKLPFFPEAIYSYLPKILEDTIHPNVLAGTLVLLLPMIIALPVFAWHELKTNFKVYYLLASLLVILVLILTQSRGAFFALTASTAMLISLRWRNGWISIAILILLSIILLSGFGVSSVIDAPDIAGDSPEKLEGRIETWSRGLYMVSDFPLTGIGMGLFSDIADALYPFFLNAADSVPHSHNLFLQVAIDLGIPGLISWLSILLIVFSVSLWLFRSSAAADKRWMSGFCAGILCSQIALAIHGMTDAVTWGMVKPAPLVWGIWGVALAAWIHDDRSNLTTTQL